MKLVAMSTKIKQSKVKHGTKPMVTTIVMTIRMMMMAEMIIMDKRQEDKYAVAVNVISYRQRN